MARSTRPVTRAEGWCGCTQPDCPTCNPPSPRPDGARYTVTITVEDVGPMPEHAFARASWEVGVSEDDPIFLDEPERDEPGRRDALYRAAVVAIHRYDALDNRYRVT